MKQKITRIFAVLCALLVISCSDTLDIQQAYNFSLSSWHLPAKIAVGEPVEIRLTLAREGDYTGAVYRIGHVQMAGNGVLADQHGTPLTDRESRPLADVPGLDTSDPCRQVFTLWYTATAGQKSEIELTATDNFGQRSSLKITFDVTPDS